MANTHLNLARETSVTTGTGTISLDGAVTGARTAVAAASTASPDGVGGSGPWTLISYKIQSDDGAVWEIGEGTLTDGSPDTLSRDTIYLNSSGTTVALNLGVGTKTIIFGVPLGSDLGGGGGSGDILIPIDLVEFSDNTLVSERNFQDEEAKKLTDTVVFGAGEIGLQFPTASTAYDLVIAVGVSAPDTSGTKNFSAQAYTYDANGTASTLNSAVVKTSHVLPDAITTGMLITWSNFIGASDIAAANTRFKFGITLTAGSANDHVGDLVLRWASLRLAA